MIVGGTSEGATMTEAFVLQPGEGRPIDSATCFMTVKATADTTDNAFSLLEASEPPNFGPPMHIHRDAAEVDRPAPGDHPDQDAQARGFGADDV